ncbi:MAG: Vms1/Ankzf1 family peptidyl-tRNA hydrolase [Thermodesulfovibrionales bacterium]|nr:Vms1/Ankzf1 family peptidyl-tRNA hydrolase [Thermodesulfovibrionales bacterium]
MLNRAELREIASMEGKESYFVSLYLNVDPMFNPKGDHMVHFKNMMKVSDTLDKAVYKKVKDDLDKIQNYVLSNKRMFKKGLALLSSSENSFWKEYNLGVPLKNGLFVDKSPYTKPLMDILDNYQRYAVLLVDKESARIFVIHLGEIVEYGEVHTVDVHGKHKKGGWFALSQNHYERHIDYHVSLHLKEVVEKLDSFLSGEYIGRLIIGGSDEAVSMIKGMLHKTVLDKVIGAAKVEMFAKSDEILSRVEPIVSAYEKKKEDETVDSLIAKALKNENAVLGLDNVIHTLQEQRVMKLIVLKDYKANGYNCSSCNFLSYQKTDLCPYCNGRMEGVDYLVDMAGEKAIQQGALIEVVSENKKLLDAGGIGAFLRF